MNKDRFINNLREGHLRAGGEIIDPNDCAFDGTYVDMLETRLFEAVYPQFPAKMTKEQFADIYGKLGEKYRRDLRSLQNEWVRQNAEFQVGDMITDGNQTIKVAKFLVRGELGMTPNYYYEGPILTKNLTPRKDGQTYCVSPEQARRP